MIEPELCKRIEETNPTDRVRGTVVNVTAGGLFVVKYDNGDYLAYQPEQAEEFHDASNKPLPSHAAELIHTLRKKYGKLPPEDVGVLRIEADPKSKRVPGQKSGEFTRTQEKK
jgi:hypothetical protein